jgi:hemerythrin
MSDRQARRGPVIMLHSERRSDDPEGMPGRSDERKITVDQEFTIGIEEIDTQHRELLDRMDLLRDYMRRGQSRDAIRDTLKFLEAYVVEHFDTEVKYMQRYSYPGILLHKAEHKTFLKDFTAFKEKYLSLQAKGELTTFLGVDIVRKLNDWFANHIATVDKKMGAFLAEKMPPR